MIRAVCTVLVAAILAACAPAQIPSARADSISSSSAESQLDQAYAAYLAQDFGTAYRLLAPLAEDGNADALAQLGAMYLRGNHVQKNPEEALRLFRLAAEKNNAKAQLQLGGMYQMGLGVPKDEAKAIALLQRAAAQGYGPAASALGRTYELGLGTEQNFSEAMRFFRLSAEKGQFYGQAGLGRLYLRGEGAPRDLVEAYMWLKLASRHEHPALKKVKQQVLIDLGVAEGEMSSAQLAEGQSRVAAWLPSIACKGDECYLLP
jgi:TPR repeat protein